MYCASFGSVTVTHSVSPRRRIGGAVFQDEPGFEGCVPLDEGVHLHRAGKDVPRPAGRPAPGGAFAVVVC